MNQLWKIVSILLIDLWMTPSCNIMECSHFVWKYGSNICNSVMHWYKVPDIRVGLAILLAAYATYAPYIDRKSIYMHIIIRRYVIGYLTLAFWILLLQFLRKMLLNYIELAYCTYATSCVILIYSVSILFELGGKKKKDCLQFLYSSTADYHYKMLSLHLFFMEY